MLMEKATGIGEKPKVGTQRVTLFGEDYKATGKLKAYDLE